MDKDRSSAKIEKITKGVYEVSHVISNYESTVAVGKKSIKSDLYYFEMKSLSTLSTPSLVSIGICTSSTFKTSKVQSIIGNDEYSWGYYFFGEKDQWSNGLRTSYKSQELKKIKVKKGDTIGCLFDKKKKKIVFYKNDELLGPSYVFRDINLTKEKYYPCVQVDRTNSDFEVKLNMETTGIKEEEESMIKEEEKEEKEKKGEKEEKERKKKIEKNRKEIEKKKLLKKKMEKLSFKNMKLVEKKIFSQLYEDLYNNEKYSDSKIKISKTNEYINIHKMIVGTRSTFLEKQFKESNEYIFEETKYFDESTLKSVLKYIYTGKIEYNNEKELIKILTMCLEYKITEIFELKINDLVLYKSIIGYLDSDDLKREKEMSLLLNVDFKKIDSNDIKKFNKKMKWIGDEFYNYLIENTYFEVISSDAPKFDLNLFSKFKL
jgi:hypothetical protein